LCYIGLRFCLRYARMDVGIAGGTHRIRETYPNIVLITTCNDSSPNTDNTVFAFWTANVCCAPTSTAQHKIIIIYTCTWNNKYYVGCSDVLRHQERTIPRYHSYDILIYYICVCVIPTLARSAEKEAVIIIIIIIIIGRPNLQSPRLWTARSDYYCRCGRDMAGPVVSVINITFRASRDVQMKFQLLIIIIITITEVVVVVVVVVVLYCRLNRVDAFCRNRTYFGGNSRVRDYDRNCIPQNDVMHLCECALCMLYNLCDAYVLAYKCINGWREEIVPTVGL